MRKLGHQSPAISHQEKESVNIFILIDALGWDYIKNRSFLDDIAVTKRPVKSILGFSSGVIPSILTGKYPQEHKHWSLYFYSPKTSPFRWTKGLLWLPKKALNSRIARKIIEEISKRFIGYSGYFETYLIPVEKLHLFDICENRNIYAPEGIRDAESIFDILKDGKIDYRCFTYPMKDKDIFAATKNSLADSESPYYFLYLSESDAMLHRSCHDESRVNEMIDYYEEQVRKIYKVAQEKYKKVNLFLFSDHSMAHVNSGFSFIEEIEGLEFEMPKDYIAFYDSTMARFWFFNSKAKDSIVSLLKGKEYGRILNDSELERLGVKFENNMYGEVIFLMKTGSVINPSFMGRNIPQGMHGYDVDDGAMDAILVSNKNIEEDIKDVKDLFKLMSNEERLLRPVPEEQSDEWYRARNDEKPCKILYFLNSLIRGGVEEHVLRLIERLDKERFELILVCPQALINLMRSDIERLQIKHYPIYIRRWSNIREIWKFLEILKFEKPDIVHSHLFFATMFAAPIAKLIGVPAVIETAHIREGWRKGIKKAYFIDRLFYRFTDKIIAVSNAVKEYLITEKRILPKKIEVIHNGVDIEKFKPFEEKGDRSQKNGTSPLLDQSPDKKFAVGVIGRLEPQKGHKYFLEAIKMLGNRGHDATFAIIGEGSLRAELEAMSRDLKIENKVKFLGFRKDVKEIIAQLDLIVLPSLYEGLPLVAIEAGAMGKPVVVTNVDGSPEAVVNNRTGLVVSTKDSAALEKGIEAFINNRELAKELGENARRHITERFNIKIQVNKTEQLYLESLNKAKK